MKYIKPWLLPECRALRQRISLVYQIKPLSENETLAYIKHRLKVAGTEKNIFTQNAVKEIYNFSKGYPRLINTICDHALLTGYARNFKKITPDVIQECAQQFNSIGETRNNNHSISQEQHHPERRSHSVTCPFVKDIATESASLENTGTRDFILPQPESTPKHINSQGKTQNNTADGSKVSIVKRLRKRKFAWTPVVSFATRMRKGLFSRASAAVPFIRRMQKRLVSWVSAASLPTFLRKRRFFWISAVSLAMMILVITGLYQKALTTKNNPPKPIATALALKTTASSLQKTEISKPNVLEQAKTALHNKNFNQAIELFEQVIAQNPTNASTIKMYYSKALRGQADIAFVKNPGTAEILLSKAVEADPKNAEAYFDLGKLYTKSNDYPNAIIAYLKAANLSYRPSDAFYNLGFIYASTKDFANAEKMFLHVVDLKPPYLDKVLFNLAVVQQKQGKEQQCIENLEKAMINNPKNQRAQQYLNQLKNDKEAS